MIEGLEAKLSASESTKHRLLGVVGELEAKLDEKRIHSSDAADKAASEKAAAVAELASEELESALEKIQKNEREMSHLTVEVSRMKTALEVSERERSKDEERLMASIEELAEELEKKEAEAAENQRRHDVALKQAYAEIDSLDKKHTALAKKHQTKLKASAIEAELSTARGTVESLKKQLAESAERMEEVVEQATLREEALQSQLQEAQQLCTRVEKSALESGLSFAEAMKDKEAEMAAVEEEYRERAQAVKQGVDHRMSVLKREKSNLEDKISVLESQMSESIQASLKNDALLEKKRSEEMAELQQAFVEACAEVKQKSQGMSLLEAELKQQQEDAAIVQETAAEEAKTQQSTLNAALIKVESLETQVKQLQGTLLENSGENSELQEAHAALSKENEALRRNLKELESRASRVQELQAEAMREVNAHEETKALLEEAKAVLQEQKEADHKTEVILDQAVTQLEKKLKAETRRAESLEAELHEAIRLAEAAAKEADELRAEQENEHSILVRSLRGELSESRRRCEELQLKESSVIDLLSSTQTALDQSVASQGESTSLQNATCGPPNNVQVNEVRMGGGGTVVSASVSWTPVEGATQYTVQRLASHAEMPVVLSAMVFHQADRHVKNGHLTLCELDNLDYTPLSPFKEWLKQDKARWFKCFDGDHNGTMDRIECEKAFREYLGTDHITASMERTPWLTVDTAVEGTSTNVSGLQMGESRVFRVFAGRDGVYETQGCLGVALAPPKAVQKEAAPRLQGRALEKMVDAQMAAFSRNLLEQGLGKGSVRKLGRDAWQVGTKKVNLSISSGALVVKVGGGYMDFNKWVEKHQSVLKGWNPEGKDLKQVMPALGPVAAVTAAVAGRASAVA